MDHILDRVAEQGLAALTEEETRAYLIHTAKLMAWKWHQVNGDGSDSGRYAERFWRVFQEQAVAFVADRQAMREAERR